MLKNLLKVNSSLLQVRPFIFQRSFVPQFRMFNVDIKSDSPNQPEQQQKIQSKMFQKKQKPFKQQQQRQPTQRDDQRVQEQPRQEGKEEGQEDVAQEYQREESELRIQQLQTIVEKYKLKKGHWSIEDIDKFVEEVSGKANIPKTKTIDHEALSEIRDQVFTHNARFVLDFGEEAENLKEFEVARKSTQPSKWQRDKFDMTFLINTQKYLLNLKAQGITKLDSNVYKDLNSMTKKYIELLGSVEFNKYMQNVLFEKLKLDQDPSFQAFITDLMFNTNDLSTTGRIRAVVLERFLFLILQLENPSFYQNFEEVRQMFLVELEYNYNVKDQTQIFKLIDDPQYMLKLNLLSLSKNHNFFGQMDNYMKEFARLTLNMNDPKIQKRLQGLLNDEIVIPKSQTQQLANNLKSKDQDYQIHPNVLAQPQFQFLPKAQKLQNINEYKELKKELDKTREMRNLLEFAKDDTQMYLRLLSSSKEFFSLLNEIENHDEKYGVFDRIKKTHTAMNEYISQIFLDRFGIAEIGLENIEQIYNPLVCGIGSLADIRKLLVSNGMSPQFADNLARQYILKLEQTENHISKMMDIFNSKNDNSQALNALQKVQTNQVVLNYQTFDQYQKEIGQREVQEKMRLMMQYKNMTQQSEGSEKPKQTRGFSTTNKSNKDAQKEQVYSAIYQDKEKQQGAKSKFFEFIKKIDEIDQQEKTKQQEQKSDYDITDLEFSFEKVSKIQDLKTTKPTLETTLEQAIEARQQEPLTEQQQHEMKLKNAREKLIFDAKKKYNYNFFKNFAFTGPESMSLAQKSLEEYIMNIESPQDIQLLIISMVNSAYELNSLIPNIELLFYKIFCSPITTKEERKDKDNDYPLFGNIFAQKKVGLTFFGYKSLLETLILHPKKKHFKKIVQHFIEYEQKEQIDGTIINMVVQLGIDQKWPVQLGKVMKHFVVNDYAIPKKAFQEFVLFLERCKGYEEDAKRFIFLTSDTENLDFTYDLVRPIFLRSITTKSGNDILKLFEQFRKNIKLNRASRHLGQQEKHEALTMKKKDFYDGLLQDFIAKSAFGLAQIVYSEKMREKFPLNMADNLIGLQIFANQKNIDEFVDIFTKILSDKIEVDTKTAEGMAQNLMIFDADKERYKRLEMTEKLQKKVFENKIVLSGELFNSLIFIYTESQQWKQVIDLLYASSPTNCQPELKTMNYLKRNLLYCFEPQTRAQLKEAMEKFEDEFFSKQSKEYKEIPVETVNERKFKVTKKDRPKQ